MNGIDTRHARLIAAMTSYDKGDVKRIQHFIKVHDIAATIGRLEKLDDETLSVLETAAIVHDIGIHNCEKKYGGRHDGKLQEKEGPAEADKLLRSLGGYRDDEIARVCWLVAHHHTYVDIVGMDYQILVEADFLVNMFEDDMCMNAIRNVRERVFKTATGIKLLDDMFGL
jgi:uncharacterized protein